MKVRIITAAVGVPVLLALILFAPLWGMGIAIGALCAVAAWELMRCSLGETPKRIYVSAILCAFCLPMMFSFGLQMTAGVGALLFLFFVLSLELMISFNGKRRITLEMVAVSMLAGAVLPLMLSTLIRVARVEDAGRVRVLVPLIVAFSSDAVEAGQFARDNTARDATFITGTQHLNPVISIAGREIVCGPDLWLYWHGFDTRQRQEEIETFYEAPGDNADIAEKYGVTYVYVSSYERNSFNVDEAGLARIGLKVFENGEASVYRLTAAAGEE